MKVPVAAVEGQYGQANVGDQMAAVRKAIGSVQYYDVAGRDNRPLSAERFAAEIGVWGWLLEVSTDKIGRPLLSATSPCNHKRFICNLLQTTPTCGGAMNS